MVETQRHTIDVKDGNNRRHYYEKVEDQHLLLSTCSFLFTMASTLRVLITRSIPAAEARLTSLGMTVDMWPSETEASVCAAVQCSAVCRSCSHVFCCVCVSQAMPHDAIVAKAKDCDGILCLLSVRVSGSTAD